MDAEHKRNELLGEEKVISLERIPDNEEPARQAVLNAVEGSAGTGLDDIADGGSDVITHCLPESRIIQIAPECLRPHPKRRAPDLDECVRDRFVAAQEQLHSEKA